MNAPARTFHPAEPSGPASAHRPGPEGRPLGSILRPSDCWQWLPPDEVCRHALAAYYRACRDCEPPAGVPFMVPDPDGREQAQPFASPAFFVEALSELLSLRLAAAAEQAGVGGYAGCVERLERWDQKTDGGDLFAASQ